jgi:hypothetical protein
MQEEAPAANQESTMEEEAPAVNQQEYDRHLEDQRYMMESGLDTAYLTHALAALPNCKAIGFTSNGWPWGAISQARQTGLFPTSSTWMPESLVFAKRALKVILAAVIASRIPLEELDISDTSNITSDMLAIPERCSQQIQSRLTGLEYLTLSVKPQTGPRWAGSVLEFITAFPALARLELLLVYQGSDKYIRITSICESLHVQALRCLMIGGASCTENELALLLLRHRDTLEEIELLGVDIMTGGSWQSLLHIIRDELSINYLAIMHCKYAGQDVFFLGGDGNGDKQPKIEVSGDRQALTDAVDSIVIHGSA